MQPLEWADRVIAADPAMRGMYLWEDGGAVVSFAGAEQEYFLIDRSFFLSRPDLLNTGRTVEHWHTRTKTAHVAILERMAPNAWLEMNPVDAKRLNLSTHDRVMVISRRSRRRRAGS